MKILRTTMVTALAVTLACDADTAPTAPARSHPVGASLAVAGSTVHLVAWTFVVPPVTAGSRLIVVSYEESAVTPLIWGVTYTAVVKLVHPEFGTAIWSLYTDAVLEPGTTLIANGPPLLGPGVFEATLVDRGSTQ